MDDTREWTFEDAVAAVRKFSEETPDSWPTTYELDRTLKLLDLYKEKYETDKRYLMEAIVLCAQDNLPMPKWVADGLINAHREIRTFQKKSWDEVLGRPFPKGAHLEKLKNDESLRIPVSRAVKRIIAEDPRQPIDAGLFEAVGAEFGIGKTKAEELYREAKEDDACPCRFSITITDQLPDK